MPDHDIIVIGASAGGLEPIRELVRSFPKELKASVFIVLHTSADSPGLLPTILGRRSKLPVQYAANNMLVRRGQVYIAPSDHHMLLEKRRIHVVRGPKENRARPAIDPLFRSAAWSHGSRVIGIILSGLLDDGVAGLWAVKESGGITIVQDPDEAVFPDMPLNAIRYVDVEYRLRIEDMAQRIPGFVKQPARRIRKSRAAPRFKLENEFAMMRRSIKDMDRIGKPSGFSCPACHGAMWELHEGQMVRYRCHVGHAFNAESLLSEQSEAVEDALYEALKSMEEKYVVLRQLADQFGKHSASEKAFYEERAAKQDRSTRIIREVLAKKRKVEGLVPGATKRSRIHD